MKGIAVVALILGIAGTALGVIALLDQDEGTEQTLALTGGKETRIEYRAPAAVNGHPVGRAAWSSNSEITGDRTGEYVRTCVPLPTDEIECSGSFLLSDGDIEVELTEEAEPQDANSDGAIVGGTGVYDGAQGSMQVDWKNDTYTLSFTASD
jgi:hypothetical protein